MMFSLDLLQVLEVLSGTTGLSSDIIFMFSLEIQHWMSLFLVVTRISYYRSRLLRH